MFIELHIIQSFGPTNLNRDEDGNPKDCDFGGVRRARISSQCLKRSIRRNPAFTRMTGVPNGMRTKRMAEEIHDYLIDGGMAEEEALQLGNQFAQAYAKKTEKSKEGKSEETNVLVYISPAEFQAAAEGLLAGKSAIELAAQLVKDTKGRTSAPDIALFGRMLADSPATNLDAAVQVAHAFSTHRVDTEYDFFTAVDDLKPTDDPGAGMMGSIGYNSACYYRYARLDWNQLLANLGGDADLACRTVKAFLLSSLEANPTGMQNSHDNQTPPALVMAVVREHGGGWSLANAFEAPVTAAREGGVIAPSVERLVDAYQFLAQNLEGDQVNPILLALQPGLPLKELEAYRVTGSQAWADAVLAGCIQG
ncbi:MAG: type I-E CRISPR-associated protein Cas7/Cse4/CasC [Anaerolineaceae bacterium]|nr:type I-E CRISPR-associated protein Cas7/Cse4/CasC [Anaerolineaceae bacterium]